MKFLITELPGIVLIPASMTIAPCLTHSFLTKYGCRAATIKMSA